MTENEFDKSINDSFHGTGKRRTELSGLFLVTVDKLFQTQGYRAVTAWEDDDSIIVCVERPDGDGFWQSMSGISAAEVRADMATAAREFVESHIDYELNPPSMLWWSDVGDRMVAICEEKAPDAIPILKETYGKRWWAAAAEVGYWHENGECLKGFMYLQEVQRVGDHLIYIYKPQRQLWRIGDPIVHPQIPMATADELTPKKRLQ